MVFLQLLYLISGRLPKLYKSCVQKERRGAIRLRHQRFSSNVQNIQFDRKLEFIYIILVNTLYICIPIFIRI